MHYNNQKHQRIFLVASIAALGIEGVSMLRQLRGYWFGTWPSEGQLNLLLIVATVAMVYVFRLASRSRESYVRAAMARETAGMTNDGNDVSLPRASGVGTPKSLISELESELEATIECHRFVLKFLDESLMANLLNPDELLRKKRYFRETLELLESVRASFRSINLESLLEARLDLWEIVESVRSFERANAHHLKKALEIVQRPADSRRPV